MNPKNLKNLKSLKNPKNKPRHQRRKQKNNRNQKKQKKLVDSLVPSLLKQKRQHLRIHRNRNKVILQRNYLQKRIWNKIFQKRILHPLQKVHPKPKLPQNKVRENHKLSHQAKDRLMNKRKKARVKVRDKIRDKRRNYKKRVRRKPKIYL